MSLLRNLLTDLVEKRLWPVAVALVAALVAVPVLLGGGGGATPGSTPVAGLATPATGGAPSVPRAQVALETDPSAADHGGTSRDPFVQRKIAKAADQAAADLSKAATGDVPPLSSSPPATGTGGAGDGSSGSGDPKTPAKPAPKADPTLYRVDLSFGETGKQKSYKDLERLAPMPDADNPFLVFLGVLDDGKTAVFLVSSDATATGDGVCKPDPTSCETIEMKAGSTEFFDLAPQDGDASATTTDATTSTPGVQYQLDLTKVAKFTAASTATAAAARSQESQLGRGVLRTAIDEGADLAVSSYAYSAQTGTLARRTVTADQGKSVDASSDHLDPTLAHYGAELHVGPQGAAQPRTDNARLQPLPSADDPLLVFLGILDDRQTAVFLNATATPAAGAGTCAPSPQQCLTVELKAGQQQLFDRSATAQGTTELDVDRVVGTASRTEDLAREARGSESGIGREALRTAIRAGAALALGQYGYDAKTGLLHRAPAAPAAPVVPPAQPAP
ncbi:MAG: hypothetical protein QOH43_2905 [Solirubrobacteraceae bacterium]|nr:hypothetical protein [Solirubrobacteraceae bacterium]